MANRQAVAVSEAPAPAESPGDPGCRPCGDPALAKQARLARKGQGLGVVAEAIGMRPGELWEHEHGHLHQREIAEDLRRRQSVDAEIAARVEQRKAFALTDEAKYREETGRIVELQGERDLLDDRAEARDRRALAAEQAERERKIREHEAGVDQANRERAAAKGAVAEDRQALSEHIRAVVEAAKRHDVHAYELKRLGAAVRGPEALVIDSRELMSSIIAVVNDSLSRR